MDLEADVEDASDEVYNFQIQRSLIYLKFGGGCTLSYHHIIKNSSRGGIISVKSYHAQLCLSISSEVFIYIFKSGYTL